jgi:glycosyltransferase involved in cell wall biosynthesis
MRLSIIFPSFNEPNVYKTIREAKALFPDAQIIVAEDKKGLGKGWSVRKGLLASCGGVIVFLDGDGDIKPRMIKRLLPFLDDYDIVVGGKGIGGMPLDRKIITLASRIFIKCLFWLDVDTQTGIKAMHRDAVIPWISDSFAFDMEFLAIAKKRGLKMIEVGIEATISKKKSIKVLWQTLVSSLKIWFRLFSRSAEAKI